MNIHHNSKYSFFILVFVVLLFLSLNSIFCKIALSEDSIDAYSFSFFRLLFGAVTLALIYFYKNKKIEISLESNWLSSFMLFAYVICFSYAYVSIDAGFGALLLFAVVQLIMIASLQFFKESISLRKLFGMIIAFIGLTYLLYPSHDFEVSYFHSFLMIFAGVAWAFYTIFGKSSKDALFNTMDNFLKATLFVALFYVFFFDGFVYITYEGLFWAFLSGSITSAIGYYLWYLVVPNMKVVTSSIIQLVVPLFAIIISVIFLEELLTLNLVLSAVLVGIGVLISLTPKKRINRSI